MSSITQAASVILARDPSAAPILIVRRSDSLRFFGGYLAFPGGKVSADDTSLVVQANQELVADPSRVAAVRELFEETGVLLARRADGYFPPASEELTLVRRELLADSLAFGTWLKQSGLRIHADDLVAVGSLVTPPFSPVRFDTAFYVALLPKGQEAEVWNGELSDGRWTTARELLDGWTRGESRITPPTVTLLELMRDHPATELPARIAPLNERLAAGALPPIPFAPGVHMLPLHSLALPPAQYTNAFLVGTEKRWLIDPGAHESQEQERLLDAIEELLPLGGELAGVIVTHWHPDHVAAVEAVVLRYRIPIFAHPDTAKMLGEKLPVTHFLNDGDRIDLGPRPDGSGPWYLEAILTPGHASGHLAFFDPFYQLLFAADMVSPLTSIVIAPPDGDLEQYLDSLQRIRLLETRLLLPSHGPPTIHARKLIDDAIAHRARREAQLMAALEAGPADVAELTGRLYESLDVQLRTLAQWQVEAGLEKLRREGRATQADSQWRLTLTVDAVTQ